MKMLQAWELEILSFGFLGPQTVQVAGMIRPFGAAGSELDEDPFPP